jgi:ADP-ribose pyrophosphatase YjhB (NUDIX family)
MSPYYRKLREKIGNDLLLTPGVAAVIHNSEGRLLLQEKAGGTWSLPAGAIEPGESPSDAVRREVREETGLIVEPSEILGVLGGPDFRYVYANGHAVEYTIVLYQCSVTGDTGRIEDTETVSLEYFSKESAPDLALPYPKSLLFGGSG